MIWTAVGVVGMSDSEVVMEGGLARTRARSASAFTPAIRRGMIAATCPPAGFSSSREITGWSDSSTCPPSSTVVSSTTRVTTGRFTGGVTNSADSRP